MMGCDMTQQIERKESLTLLFGQLIKLSKSFLKNSDKSSQVSDIPYYELQNLMGKVSNFLVDYPATQLTSKHYAGIAVLADHITEIRLCQLLQKYFKGTLEMQVNQLLTKIHQAVYQQD